MEETPTPSNDAPVCANCGRPAIYKTTTIGVNQVYLCYEHGQRSGEPLEPLKPVG